jgi:hypothetical protein
MRNCCLLSVVVLGVVGGLLAPLGAWAGGNPQPPACLVTRTATEEPKFRGVLAMDITSPNPGGTGFADVALRLDVVDQVREPVWFRATHSSIFTDTTLLAYQHQLCEVLTTLTPSINSTFGLPAGTQFVFKKNGIRNAEIDVDPSILAVPPNNEHAMTLFDVIIFVRR